MVRRYHHFLVLALALVLAGCDTPSISMLGVRATEVTIDGSRFRVFMQPGGTRVEAHRVSLEMLPSKVVTFERAFRAIELATGCSVLPGSLAGDRAIILAEVLC